MTSAKLKYRERMAIVILALCVLVSMLLPAGSSFAYAEDGQGEGSVYHDGVYEGTAEGYRSDITVAVTIADGKIAEVKVVSENETPSYWRKAQPIVNDIVAKQTHEVDSVSGATISCEAIKTATKIALDLAMADPGSPFSQGDGSKDSPYVISSAEKLAQFAQTVDEGEDYAGKIIKLDEDMDLSRIKNWNPIGAETQGTGTTFAGEFDGQGHKISGMKIAGTFRDDSNIGLFSALAGTAKVSGLKIIGANVKVKSNKDLNAGLVVGDQNSAEVSSTSAEGVLNVQTAGSAKVNAGGVSGEVNGGRFVNNYSDVAIDVFAQGASAEAFAGGIAGKTYGGVMVINNASSGDVYVSTPQAANGATAGGLVGRITGSMWNNYASGDVTVGNNGGAGNIGALAGSVDTDANLSTNYYAGEAGLKVETQGETADASAPVVTGEAVTRDEMKTEGFVDTLNDGLSDVSSNLKSNNIQDLSINEWKLESDVAVPTGRPYTPNSLESTATVFDSGKGTKKNPYVIKTKEQLIAFGQTVTDGEVYTKKYIVLGADIDMAGETWTPAGAMNASTPKKAFGGIFDGNGYKISNLTIGSKETPVELGTIDKTTKNVAGFFTVLGTGSIVRNVEMENAGFYASSNAGAQTGILAGAMNQGSTVDNCRVQGTSELTCTRGNAFHGGMIGRSNGAVIINCISDVEVMCENSGSYPETGGIVGMNNGGLLANSCNLGNVVSKTGTGNAGYTLAGLLAGYQTGDIVNCYAKGNLTTNDDSQFSGLLAGWTRDYARTYCCWYDQDSTLTMNGKKIDPVKAIGVEPAAVPDSDGKFYLGGLTDKVRPFDSDPEIIDILENGLNNLFVKFPVDVEKEFGVDPGALRSWEADAEGNVFFGEDHGYVRYSRPDCEVIPQKELFMTPGKWYGRDEAKTTVVAITVADNKVKDVDIIEGESTGSGYEEAVEKAKEKAIYGDVSTYGEANAAMFGGGSGTKEDPYKISNEAQLRYLADSINEDVDWEGKYFKQTGNITLTMGDWNPIGWGIVAEVKARVTNYAEYPFRGNYDGGGYVIKNLKIGSKSQPSASPRCSMAAGLFGYVAGDEVTSDTPQDPDTRYVNLSNIKIQNADIIVAAKYGVYAGTLVGSGENGIRIENCYADGSLNVQSEEGNVYAGGLAAYPLRGLVKNAIAKVQVNAAGEKSNVYAGGMFGMDNRVTTVNSFATGNVKADSENGGIYAGGMSGSFAGIRYNCYTTGDVEAGTDSQYVGLVNGQHAGIGGESFVYYNNDAKLTVAGNQVEKKTSGYSAGRPNQSSLVAMSKAEMEKADFANLLNGNHANAKTELETMHGIVKDINPHGHGMYYPGDGSDLTKWVVSDGKVSLDKAEPAKEVTPAPSPQPTPTPTPTPAKISINNANVTVAQATYTGKALKPAVTVKVGDKTLAKGTDYTVAYSNNVKAGKGKATVSGNGNYAGERTVTFKINKAKNTLIVKAKTIKVKFKTLKKKAQKIAAKKAYKVTKAKGNVTYVKSKGNKKIKIAKAGKVTVEKGIKKGSYKVIVKVRAAGNANYKAITKTVTLKVRVK